MRFVKLRHLASIAISNVDKKSMDGEIPVRLCNYTDVYYNGHITNSIPFMEATATPDQLRSFQIHAGDILLTKDSETPDDIAIPSLVDGDLPGVVCGYHLALVRPHPALVDPRYLYWALASVGVRAQSSANATGITRFGLRQDLLGGIFVPVHEITEQRLIADSLDRETARVDGLVAAKRKMKGLLLERLNTSVEGQLNALSMMYGQAPLKFLADEITVGIVNTPSEWYADSGVPALRGLNVRAGELRLDDLVHLSEEGHRRNLKSELHAGNLVTVRTGQAGATAIVPREFEGANCIDLLITRPGSKLVPEFLELVFNSDWVVKHIDANSVGAIQAHFNVAALRDLPVPNVSVEVQREVSEQLVVERALTWKLIVHLTSQMKLLGERRQALINAAVGGDLTISGAAAA
jgi:type I restriction enzyme S subunit